MDDTRISITYGESGMHIGAIAGYAQKSLVYNCKIGLRFALFGDRSLLFGGLIGYAELSEIYCCSCITSDGIIIDAEGVAICGGLIGELISSHLSECFAKVTFEVNTVEVSNIDIGGLVGVSDSSINNVYTHANISTSGLLHRINGGALIGRNHRGVISNAYTKSTINYPDTDVKEKLIGALIGYNDNIANNCYYCINKEIKYSCGTSLKEIKATRVNEEGLKGLAKQISDAFYDGEDNVPHLNFEKEDSIL